jgi:hypothetical protein
MISGLYHGIRIMILPRRENAPGEPLGFPDRSAARAFLRGLRSSVVIRQFLAGECAPPSLARMNDDEMLRFAVGLIATGRVKIVKQEPEWRPPGAALDESPKEQTYEPKRAAPPPAPAAPEPAPAAPNAEAQAATLVAAAESGAPLCET